MLKNIIWEGKYWQNYKKNCWEYCGICRRRRRIFWSRRKTKLFYIILKTISNPWCWNEKYSQFSPKHQSNDLTPRHIFRSRNDHLQEKYEIIKLIKFLASVSWTVTTILLNTSKIIANLFNSEDQNTNSPQKLTSREIWFPYLLDCYEGNRT